MTDELKPFAHFRWNDGWKVWEQVVDSAAGKDGVVAAYRRAEGPAPPHTPEDVREAVEAEIVRVLDGFHDGQRERKARDIVKAILPILRAPPIGEVGELKADFARALPGGKLDDSEFEAIETALDRADAPCRADGDTGRWLTLPERIAALSRQGDAKAEEAWRWLAARLNYELSFGSDDDDEPGQWRVHSVGGNVNDREWTLRGTGETPLAAVLDAISSTPSEGERE